MPEIGAQSGFDIGQRAQDLIGRVQDGLEAAAETLGLDGLASRLERLLSTPSPLDRFAGGTRPAQARAEATGQTTGRAGAGYTVRAGDTLSGIAARHGTSVATLARINGIADPDRIAVGQRLSLSANAPVGGGYTVRSGDTLSAIAARHGTDVAKLARANGIADPDRIAVGQRLSLPGGTATQAGAGAGASASAGVGNQTTPATTTGAGGLSERGLQFIYDHEAQRGVSNHLHWPKGASGVTLGPGYDMKGRSAAEITRDLTAIGVDPAAARKAAEGAGLTGAAAQNFAAANRNLINLTPAQERQLLQTTVKGYADHVRAQIKVPVTQNQFDAMVSFAYNIGTSGFDGSSALRKLNAGDPAGAAEAMKLWNKSDGRVNPGLVNRRNDEVALFNSPSGPAAQAPRPATTEAPATPAPASSSDRSPAALARVIETSGDAQARADLAAGRKVVVALRTDTNANVNGGKGAYDDTIAVVWRDGSGTLRARTFNGNTEPSAQYSTEGPKAARGSSTDMNGDGRNDLGRLQAGTMRYTQQAGTFSGNTFFRADRTQVAERDTNHDGAFDSRDTNRIDRSGAGTSMLIHQGGSNNTWSAGCQTIASADFNAFVASLGGQRSFSYVLVNAR